MRWVSFSSEEFAFLSIAGNAQGIIAIGGVARGVIAIGGIASVGVVSVGMNALGSVAAFGMNAAAPISLALINGVGIYALAGVNAWGALSTAGVNASGISGRGGVNTSMTMLPAIVVIAALVVGSIVVRGSRASRAGPASIRLERFLRSPALSEARVRANLVAVRDAAIELADGNRTVTLDVADSSIVERARRLAASEELAPSLLVEVERVEEVVQTNDANADYRHRPDATRREVLRCLDVGLAPPPGGWLPRDSDEVQWVIAWSARIAALVSLIVVIWRLA